MGLMNMSTYNTFCLDLYYEDFIAGQVDIINADQHDLLRQAFIKFKKWTSSNIKKPIKTGIYGGAYTGAMAYHWLTRDENIDLKYVFNRERPSKTLSELDYINLEADKSFKKISLDLVVLTTAPIHYPDIIKTLKEKIDTKYICLLFKEKPITGRTINLPLHFIDGNKRYQKNYLVDIDYSALILIDIWSKKNQTNCPYCAKLPPLLQQARKNNILIIHGAHHDLGDNLALHANTMTPRMSVSQYLATQRMNHLRTINQPTAASNGPMYIHHCAAPLNGEREFIEYDYDNVIRILKKNKISTLFFIGGATLLCVVFRDIGYNKMMRQGYNGIIVRDLTIDERLCFDKDEVDMKKAGIFTFERLGGF